MGERSSVVHEDDGITNPWSFLSETFTNPWSFLSETFTNPWAFYQKHLQIREAFYQKHSPFRFNRTRRVMITELIKIVCKYIFCINCKLVFSLPNHVLSNWFMKGNENNKIIDCSKVKRQGKLISVAHIETMVFSGRNL